MKKDKKVRKDSHFDLFKERVEVHAELMKELDRLEKERHISNIDKMIDKCPFIGEILNGFGDWFDLNSGYTGGPDCDREEMIQWNHCFENNDINDYILRNEVKWLYNSDWKPFLNLIDNQCWERSNISDYFSLNKDKRGKTFVNSSGFWIIVIRKDNDYFELYLNNMVQWCWENAVVSKYNGKVIDKIDNMVEIFRIYLYDQWNNENMIKRKIRKMKMGDLNKRILDIS